jgi:hypothetical protein
VELGLRGVPQREEEEGCYIGEAHEILEGRDLSGEFAKEVARLEIPRAYKNYRILKRVSK